MSEVPEGWKKANVVINIKKDKGLTQRIINHCFTSMCDKQNNQIVDLTVLYLNEQKEKSSKQLRQ